MRCCKEGSLLLLMQTASDGTRFIRRIREKWPVKDMRVAGERYYLYWMDEDFLLEWWKSGQSMAV
mgnify:CR=1 FL=1